MIERKFDRGTLHTCLGFPKLFGDSYISHFLMKKRVSMHKGGVEVWVVTLDFWGALETSRLCVGRPGGIGQFTWHDSFG